MAPSSRISASDESRNLDLLRATAVLLVFAAHLFILLIDDHHIHVNDHEVWKLRLEELGHVGVLFFFVHTALVLMLSLERTQTRHLIWNFYIRRLFRIYPLSIFCIVAILLFKIPQVPTAHYVHWAWNEIVSNLLLVQDITHAPDMIAPLWTLPREVQMYLALPFIYLAVRRIPSSLFVLVLWCALFAAVPVAPILFYFPCFIGGVFAYQLAKERVFRLPAAIWPVAIFLLFSAHVLATQTFFGDFRSDFVMCMFLGGVIPNVVDLKESWLTRASQKVAKYSYGIYLCHDPILWISFVKLGSLPIMVQWSALVLLLILIPVAAYGLLESPMIKTGRRIARSLDAGRSKPEVVAVLVQAP